MNSVCFMKMKEHCFPSGYFFSASQKFCFDFLSSIVALQSYWKIFYLSGMESSLS